MQKIRLIKKIKHNKIIFNATASLMAWLLKLLFSTYRIRVVCPANAMQPFNKTEGIFYAWHQNIMAASAFLYKNNFSLHSIVSSSRDGQFIGTIIKKLGYNILYGSSYKNPIALIRKSLAVLQKDKQLFLIGDGSRGPAKQLQPGALYFSKKSQLPLIFIDCKAAWKITLKKSWDKSQIPLPFSKIYITLQPCSYK